MSPILTADIAILGGEPAGASAALALLRDRNPSVVIVDQGKRPGRKIGETLQPTARGALEELGVWEAFLAAGHTPSHGTCSAWGHPELTHSDFLFRPQGSGWHIDRNSFEDLLLAQAQQRGAVLLRPAMVGDTWRTREGWRLKIHPADGATREIIAKFVIDATGRRVSFARQRGAQKVIFDELVGLYAFFSLDEKTPLQDSFTMVETSEDGWWYSAILPEKQLVVAYMTDADEARADRMRSRKRWHELLRATTHTKKRLEGTRMIAKPRVAIAATHLLHPVAGENWLAAGDSASSFDPLSSYGIVKALRAGLRSAWAIESGNNGSYRQQIAEEFESYLETKQRFYRMESRWAHRSFWKRRHGGITIGPRQSLRCAALDSLPGLRMHLPSGHLTLLAQLCAEGCEAHEIVNTFRSRVPTNYSDSRIILALQYLAESGVIEDADKTPIAENAAGSQ